MKTVLKALVIGLSLCSLPAFAASDWAASERGLEMVHATESDVIAKTEILTAYMLNHWLYQMPLKVQVQGRVATVLGEVENETEKEMALEIAKVAQGINRVEDRIQINPSVMKRVGFLPFAQKVRDLNITMKVTDKIKKSHKIAGTIKVTTFQGNVTLSGTVKSAQQKRKAEEIATETYGVVKVESRLTIR